MNGPMQSLLGWLTAALAFSAASWGAPAGWQEPVALLGLGFLLVVSKRQPLPGLAHGSATAIVLSHGVSWLGWPSLPELTSLAAQASQFLPHLLPLLAGGRDE
jgi:hypothetical protein